MSNNVRRQRSALRRAGSITFRYFRRRRDAILSDARSVGLDSIKGGLAAVLINAFVDNLALLYAGLAAVAVGLVLWLVGLPPKGEKKP